MVNETHQTYTNAPVEAPDVDAIQRAINLIHNQQLDRMKLMRYAPMPMYIEMMQKPLILDAAV